VFVPGRTKDRSADDGNNANGQDHEDHIVLENFVRKTNNPRQKWQVESGIKSLPYHGERTERKDHESSEEQNMEASRSQISRLTKLPKSVGNRHPYAPAYVRESGIGLRLSEKPYPLVHNERKQTQRYYKN